MITEAVILAGGKGTRLSSVIQDLPKPMAPINETPFLTYILEELHQQGIETAYLAVGYLREKIIDYYGNWYKNIKLFYVIEDAPLGTGGAIKKALTQTKTNTPIIINGDTFFSVDFTSLFNFHTKSNSYLTLALKQKENADRYGTVEISSEGLVKRFIEKQPNSKGLINGGIYVVNKEKLNLSRLPEVFSFETEVLEKEYQNGHVYGFPSDGYFIDIGIPTDYEIAQSDLTFPDLGASIGVNSSWTLFLDRDGVINKKRDNDYVKSIDEFEFLPNVKETISKLNQKFGRLIVVTNQQCIGKEIISESDLESIHDHMSMEINNEGGSITAIYYAPHLVSENSIYRKPGAGMADQAKQDFPEIDFSKCIMIGDSISDMEFGKRKGMITIGIGLNNSNLIDYNVDSFEEVLNLIS